MKPWFTATLCVLWACAARSDGAPVQTGKVEGKVTLIDNGRPRASAAEVAVWIEATRLEQKKETAAPKPKEPAPAMTSEHKKFHPRLLAVPVGDAVAFPNQDPIFHNVFSVSGENRFDLGLYRRGKSKEKTFEKPGLVRVYCNIHPQMVG